MSRPLSVYLDLARFLAAALVFLGHVSSQSISGGFLWQSMRFGAPAVVIFFVLSGFVIRHAAQEADGAREYVVSRAARIYSVVLPALALTIALDEIGSALRPDVYEGIRPILADARTLPFALAFLNCAWSGAEWTNVGSNCSYWSLGYEVPYYALFGFLWFGRGAARAVGVVVTAAVAGPGVMMLSPLWFLGAGTHWLTQRWTPGPRLAWLLFFGSAAVGIGAAVLHDLPVSLAEHDGAHLVVDAVLGAAFAAHIIGCQSLPPNLFHRALARFERPIRWVAGATFTLYLLHVPVAMCFKSLSPWDVASWKFRTGVLLVPLLASFAVAEFTERRKLAWRRWFDRVLPGQPQVGPRSGHSRATLPMRSEGRQVLPAARLARERRNKPSAG